MKKCTLCKQIKAESKFNKDRTNKDGLNYRCKLCQNEYRRKHRGSYMKKWYEEHKEERAEYGRNYYREHKKKHQLHNKKYYKEHREECLANGKQWQETHREEYNSIVRRWQKRNPEKFGGYVAKANAKRQRTLGWTPLYPNPFNGCEIINWHHLDDEYMVALPKDLHQLGGAYNGTNVEFHRINLSYIVEQIYGVIGGDVGAKI